MISIAKFLMRLVEMVVSIPVRMARFFAEWIVFNPQLGPLRYVAIALIGYVAFAIVLVYVVAPVRGHIGQLYLSDKLRYDAERWLATAIYDKSGNFVGTFDPRLDSKQDVNWTGETIEIGDYTSNPDHKSIPVRTVPEHYWKCLTYHEDRHIGTALNPFGIDILGVLKIPYSTVKRSLALGRPALGVGGSTLPMQIARVIYKTPPKRSEGPINKLKRKLGEWWLAPVIYAELTQGGDNSRLKQWAANHLWLAQRTGGTSLHGVELASRIVFGKEARDLSVAEQFVLASAVNKPIILLEGSENLNRVRIDRWRYIAEVRARVCAEKLIDDDDTKKAVVFDLIGLAGGPPDPRVQPGLDKTLESLSPRLAARARANPVIRANTLMPAARYGLREQMKQSYGFDWRNNVRGLQASIDAGENLQFTQTMRSELVKLNAALEGRIDPGYTLDPARVGPDVRLPHVAVVAADADGHIVRYFENTHTASYFGSPVARDSQTGFYERPREPRMIASVGKIIAAIAIANEGKDNSGSLYVDTTAPKRGLETCRQKGNLRRGRKAVVAFACSLNSPLINRTAKVGQARIRSLIDRFAFNMPLVNANGEGTPPSTAAVLGQIAGSPRRVHQMSSVVLNSLIGRDSVVVRRPTLIDNYDYTATKQADGPQAAQLASGIQPKSVIKKRARPLIKKLLQAPLCYRSNGKSHGTLKSLSKWCATRRSDLRFHFAKTGTQVTLDPDATVDAWATGGLQFTNGAAYSYVVVVGTGSASSPWARSVHSSQAAAPLLAKLLPELAAHAAANPRRDLLPTPKRQISTTRQPTGAKTSGWRAMPESERNEAFGFN
ncbi:MAG: transglycosylase domain-containing protein [Alphaproteobacteria bacterium]|nr:transglycosylase domain-containing protein [Alphaproteobacteria bacterium]